MISQKTVLKNVSFSIGKGKATGLIGPSGAGKTTIFSLLERFYLPASFGRWFDIGVGET